VGNAIETREALDVLTGGAAPADLVECTMKLGAEMLLLGGAASSEVEARAKLAAAVASGAAARTAERMIEAQGGDPRVVADRARLEVAPVERVVEAPRDGYIVGVDALAIGLAAVAMGAGRTRADQSVDHGVGLLVEAKPGARVVRGQPLARIRVRSAEAAEVIRDRVASAVTIGDAPPKQQVLVLDRIAANSTAS
jgi:pyrimidine-nucleoside phosphorylase